MEMPIIIPSYKRAGRVTSHRMVVGAKICVPESEYAAYRDHHHAEELITHPDSIKGSALKREWILAKYKRVFQLDDDCAGIFRIWRPAGYKLKGTTLTPEETTLLIERSADTCKELGAYLFGFNLHANPMTYNGFRPYAFGGYVMGGAFGILEGSRLHFGSMMVPGCDHFLPLWNLYAHRYCWLDRRFAFAFKQTYTGVGGLTDLRADRGEERGYEFLRKCFGKAIVKKTSNLSAGRQTTKRELNRGARLIVIPWTY